MTSHRTPLHRVLSVLMLTLLIGSLAWSAPSASAVPSRIQPQLLALTEDAPAQRVRVIVRAQGEQQALHAAIVRQGGQVLRQLALIDALVAELPAAALGSLARHASVAWISLDAPTASTSCAECIDTSTLASSFIKTIRADALWNEAPSHTQGENITVAIVDSGVAQHRDFTRIPQDEARPQNRLIDEVSFSSTARGQGDSYGHGTHIAGVIGGAGTRSDGAYLGVAPRVNLVSVKVSGEDGTAYLSDVIAGLEWIYQNRHTHNIRVVNLSLTSTVAESYHTSPLNAALEVLWFNRVVVVVAAGNTQGALLYPPANDPFVITVGALDDRGTADWADDVVASYSGYGLTQEGRAKPELVAPGHNIVGLLCGSCALAQAHPERLVSAARGKEQYFRLSGTSMAAAVTTGAVALLLSGEVRLTPDQVKDRLIATARPVAGLGAGAGALDIYAAARSTRLASANTGLPASQLLWSGPAPATWSLLAWDSLSWEGASWLSVNWGSVRPELLTPAQLDWGE